MSPSPPSPKNRINTKCWENTASLSANGTIECVLTKGYSLEIDSVCAGGINCDDSSVYFITILLTIPGGGQKTIQIGGTLSKGNPCSKGTGVDLGKLPNPPGTLTGTVKASFRGVFKEGNTYVKRTKQITDSVSFSYDKCPCCKYYPNEGGRGVLKEEDETCDGNPVVPAGNKECPEKEPRMCYKCQKGCTNPFSPNYNEQATEDDNSCRTCSNAGLCVVNDPDEGDNCNPVGNGCCDGYCETAEDCAPSFSNSFTAKNGTFYPSCS